MSFHLPIPFFFSSLIFTQTSLFPPALLLSEETAGAVEDPGAGKFRTDDWSIIWVSMYYIPHCNINKKKRVKALYQLDVVKLRLFSSLYGVFKTNVSVAWQRQLQLTVCELLPGVDHQPVPPHIPTVQSAFASGLLSTVFKHSPSWPRKDCSMICKCDMITNTTNTWHAVYAMEKPIYGPEYFSGFLLEVSFFMNSCYTCFCLCVGNLLSLLAADIFSLCHI